MGARSEAVNSRFLDLCRLATVCDKKQRWLPLLRRAGTMRSGGEHLMVALHAMHRTGSQCGKAR